MNTILRIVSFIGLVLTIVPSVLVFMEKLDWETHALLMAVGTLLWFATSPFWMRKRKEIG